MGTVHACHQVNQLRPLHFVTPLLVITRERESGTMLVPTEFYFLSERPCLLHSHSLRHDMVTVIIGCFLSSRTSATKGAAHSH